MCNNNCLLLRHRLGGRDKNDGSTAAKKKTSEHTLSSISCGTPANGHKKRDWIHNIYRYTAAWADAYRLCRFRRTNTHSSSRTPVHLRCPRFAFTGLTTTECNMAQRTFHERTIRALHPN